MKFLLSIALTIVFGLSVQAKADCPNGQCSTFTLQSPMTLQSGMILTTPAQTKTVQVTIPERQFVLTEVPGPSAQAKKGRFKLRLFKKCGG